MEPDQQKALIVVLIAGSLIGAVSFTALYFIFRAFGGAKAGKGRHMGLIFGLLTFVFLCCFLLFRLSYVVD